MMRFLGVEALQLDGALGLAWHTGRDRGATRKKVESLGHHLGCAKKRVTLVVGLQPRGA